MLLEPIRMLNGLKVGVLCKIMSVVVKAAPNWLRTFICPLLTVMVTIEKLPNYHDSPGLTLITDEVRRALQSVTERKAV